MYAIRLLICRLCPLQVEEGWWEGMVNGKQGLFPSNFVKLVDEEEPATEKIGKFFLLPMSPHISLVLYNNNK